MNTIRFFNSLVWGAAICLPVMVLAAREVEHMEVLEDYLWVPVVVAMLALTMKVILTKKKN